MATAFPPRPVDEQARDWLKHRLEWEETLAALRHAQRGEGAGSRRPQQEPAAA